MGESLRELDFAPVVSGSLPDALTRAGSSRLAAVIADINALVDRKENTAIVESVLRAAIEGLRATQPSLASQRSGYLLPIIVTSNYDNVVEHAVALSAGADLYLSEAAAMSETIIGSYLERLLRSSSPDPSAVEQPAKVRHVADIFALPTEDFRSANGRLDATRIADALKVPLTKLAEAVNVPYPTVHKTPDSEALQPLLTPFANVLAMLHQIYKGDAVRIRAWLQGEQRALGGQAPRRALLIPRGAHGVEQFVAGAWLGDPE